MNYTENLVPITDTDRAYLKKQSRLVILILSAILLLFWGVAIAFCVFEGDWYVLFFIGFFSLIVIFFGWFAKRRISSYISPDAKKWVIEGEIVEKKEETTLEQRSGKQDMDTEYFLVFANRIVKVNYNHYKSYNAGDIVRVETTENGELTLNVNPIKINQKSQDDAAVNDWLSDYSEYMQDDERLIIKKLLVKRSVILIITLFILYFIAYIASAFIIVYNLDGASRTELHLMVLGRYYFVAFWALVFFLLFIRKLLSDFLSNQKKIITCTVKDKIRSNVKLLGRNIRTSVRGDYHYIQVGKKLYNIPEDDFYGIEIGNKIKIHVGNKSGVFLRIENNKR